MHVCRCHSVILLYLSLGYVSMLYLLPSLTSPLPHLPSLTSPLPHLPHPSPPPSLTSPPSPHFRYAWSGPSRRVCVSPATSTCQLWRSTPRRPAPSSARAVKMARPLRRRQLSNEGPLCRVGTYCGQSAIAVAVTFRNTLYKCIL